MRSQESFECTCPCGATNRLTRDGSVFTCKCGRRSLIDWGIGYSERELIAILNDLDVQRDRVARAIENRRDRRAIA